MKNTKVETFRYLIFLSYILVYTHSHTSLGEPFENEVVVETWANSWKCHVTYCWFRPAADLWEFSAPLKPTYKMLDFSSVLENDPWKTELFVFMDFLKTREYVQSSEYHKSSIQSKLIIYFLMNSLINNLPPPRSQKNREIMGNIFKKVRKLVFF